MHLNPGIVLCLGAVALYCLLGAIAYNNWGRTAGALAGGFAGAIATIAAMAAAPPAQSNHMNYAAAFWPVILLVISAAGFVVGAILGLIAGVIGKAVYPGAEATLEKKRAVKRRVLLGFSLTGFVVVLAVAYWGVLTGAEPFEW